MSQRHLLKKITTTMVATSKKGPFPFSMYPLYKRRTDWSNLATTGFEHEAARPHYKGTIAYPAEEGQVPDFVDDGVGYMWPEPEKRPDLYPAMKQLHSPLLWRPEDVAPDTFDTAFIRHQINTRHNINPRHVGHQGFAHTVMVRSLRDFLRRRGYSDAKIDDIIADNYTTHKADMEDALGNPERVMRRPAYIFSPEAHKAMMKHLQETGEVFGEGGSKIPFEQGGHLMGTMSIDTETGTPFVHVTHFIPVTQTNPRTNTAALNRLSSLRTINEIRRENPHLFYVGDAHSHPPDSTAEPSPQDLQAWTRGNGANHPYNLHIIHSSNTIRDHEGNLLSGEEAHNYLRRYAQFHDRDSEEPEPWPNRDVRPIFYTGQGVTNTRFFSGYHGGVVPEYNTLWAPNKRQYGYPAGNPEIQFRPSTSTFLSSVGGRILFPNQVTFLGQEPPPNQLGEASRRQGKYFPFIAGDQENPNTGFGEKHTWASLKGLPQQIRDELPPEKVGGPITIDNDSPQVARLNNIWDDPYASIVPKEPQQQEHMDEAERRAREYLGFATPPKPYSAPGPEYRAPEARPSGRITPRAARAISGEGSAEQERIASRIRAQRESPPITTVSRHTKSFGMRPFPFASYPHEFHEESQGRYREKIR